MSVQIQALLPIDAVECVCAFTFSFIHPKNKPFPVNAVPKRFGQTGDLSSNGMEDQEGIVPCRLKTCCPNVIDVAFLAADL